MLTYLIVLFITNISKNALFRVPYDRSFKALFPSANISGVAVVPQESYLSSSHMISCGADRRLCLWNLQLGTLVGIYTDSTGSEVCSYFYTSKCNLVIINKFLICNICIELDVRILGEKT